MGFPIKLPLPTATNNNIKNALVHILLILYGAITNSTIFSRTCHNPIFSKRWNTLGLNKGHWFIFRVIFLNNHRLINLWPSLYPNPISSTPDNVFGGWPSHKVRPGKRAQAYATFKYATDPSSSTKINNSTTRFRGTNRLRLKPRFRHRATSIVRPANKLTI